MHCGKTDDWIWMRFGIVGQMGPGMRQVVGFGDRSTGENNLFGGECAAPHCNYLISLARLSCRPGYIFCLR